MQSNGQESLCDAVNWSSSKNDGQDFSPITALTMVSIGVSPPCKVLVHVQPHIAKRRLVVGVDSPLIISCRLLWSVPGSLEKDLGTRLWR